MRALIRAVAVGSLLWATVGRCVDSTPTPKDVAPDRISLYQVPLVCPAAPHIGCGSRSKPILLALEQQPAVAEAWLNTAGTMMAVVWKPDAKRKDRAAELKAVTAKEELEAVEMHGASRKQALKDFLSGQGWFRGADVDRLSEEEAGIIAARLVRRIQAKVQVPEEKAEALRVAIRDVFKRHFTGNVGADEPNIETQMLNLLGGYLGEKDVDILKDTLPRTVQPLPGEK